MKDLGKGYIILGYILLPFVAIYKLITNTAKDMTTNQSFFFYFFMLIIILQIGEILFN